MSWAGEALCSLGLAVIGVWFAAVAWRMPMFEDGVPGPGLAPAILGIALLLLGGGIAIAAVIRRSHVLVPLIERDTLISVGLMLVAVTAFERVGYLPSVFLFLLSSFVLISRQPWKRSAVVSGVATLVTWGLFVKALGVQLPSGMLGLS